MIGSFLEQIIKIPKTTTLNTGIKQQKSYDGFCVLISKISQHPAIQVTCKRSRLRFRLQRSWVGPDVLFSNTNLHKKTSRAQQRWLFYLILFFESKFSFVKTISDYFLMC